MKSRFLFVLLPALLVVAACGGGGDDEPASPTGATTTSTSTHAATPIVSSTAAATPPLTATIPSGFTYVVQQGDTLYSIAQRFGSTVEAIRGANGIEDPTRISTGQVLVIPGGATVVATPVPTSSPSGGAAEVVRIGNASRREVAFTFDAGSDPGYTGMILDTLAANGITASFGMTGKWAEANPDLLRRIADEGHSLINHSYDHPSFTGGSTDSPPLSQAERWDQLDRTEETVLRVSGATTKPYFRPPYGAYDESVNADVGARGYAYNVMWAVDSRGWMGIQAPEITSRCLELAEPGAIYVFHVGAASQDGPALQAIIDGLRADGYAMGDINRVLAP